MDPLTLPIRRFAAEIVASVRENPVTVVIGETGSGKTTQIAQLLEEAGVAEGGVIGVTQPRRVVSAAARIQLVPETPCSDSAWRVCCACIELLAVGR